MALILKKQRSLYLFLQLFTNNLRKTKLAPTTGFAKQGGGVNIGICALSSEVQADGILSANEQIINFLFYFRQTVSGRRKH